MAPKFKDDIKGMVAAFRKAAEMTKNKEDKTWLLEEADRIDKWESAAIRRWSDYSPRLRRAITELERRYEQIAKENIA